MATASRKGGGNGATADMRASIVNTILNYADRANWEEPDRANQVFNKLEEAPERFINPNPNTCGSYQEEASRIYNKIKEKYGLRTARDLHRDRIDYESQAGDRLKTEIREQIETFGLESVKAAVEGNTADVSEDCESRVESVLESEPVDVYYPEFEHYESLDPESADLPEPETDPEPEPEPVDESDTTADPAGADQTDIAAAVESVESAAVESEPEPVDESDTTADRSIARLTGALVGRMVSGSLRWLVTAIVTLARLAAPRAVSGAKSTARLTGAVIGFTARLTLSTAIFTLKLSLAIVFGFVGGLVAGMVQ